MIASIIYDFYYSLIITIIIISIIITVRAEVYIWRLDAANNTSNHLFLKRRPRRRAMRPCRSVH